jgi:signal transduction histidine kinase
MELKILEEQQSKFANRLVDVIDKERSRIASELHDTIGQALTLQAFDIVGIKKSLLPSQISLQKRLDTMYYDLGKVVESVQQICTSLRPSVLDEMGLTSAVKWLVNDFSRRTGITIQLEWKAITCNQTTCSATIFRIVQEALTNIGKHANASKISIKFYKNDNKAIVHIKDNGCGFIPGTEKRGNGNGNGLGLIGMKERAKSLGAELVISSKPNQGSSVYLIIPCKESCLCAT